MRSQLPMSSAVLYRTVSAILHTAAFPTFNLHSVRRNHGAIANGAFKAISERGQNAA